MLWLRTFYNLSSFFLGGFLGYGLIQIFLFNKSQQNAETKDILKDDLFNEVKILCWIMISPKYHLTRGVHIKKTWGRKCNKLLFMSSEHDPVIDSIALPGMKEKITHLWSKTRKAFQLIHDEYLEEADWFLKADDDTYMIMENLRQMLFQYNPKTALYLGQRLISNESRDGFMQGGAYVLSKKAVKKFIKLYPNCRKKDGWAEDLYMGKKKIYDKILKRIIKRAN